LRDDIGEQHDLSTDEPAKTAELRDKLHAWRQSLNAPMPTANQPTDAPAEKSKRSRRRAARAAQLE
jgi:hypothetical protein